MPSIQAYSVDWTVEIAPEGDISNDVTEITYTRERGNPNSVTVTLDTSQRPHALEEQADIRVVLSDANDTVEFNGFVDDVNDAENEPTVTVDARTPEGLLDDTSVVGTYDKTNLWDVVEAVIDTGPSRIREISYDAEAAKSKYGLFSGQTDFGSVSVAHYARFGVNSDSFSQHEVITDDRGQQAELRIDNYENTTASTYTMDITGKDADGNTVKASLDLPPGADAQEAFGTDEIKLALSGGNQLWTEVNSISTDVPDLIGNAVVALSGNIYNYVKTLYNFSATEGTKTRNFLSRLTSYIQSLDGGREWEYFVDDAADELIIRPRQTRTPSLYTFTEGSNVIRPIAKRNIDDVVNYVQVHGAGGVNVWTWAYNGDVWTMWGDDNPHERGVFPDDPNNDKFTWKWKDSPANGINDIDQINLRATSVSDTSIQGWYQALAVSHTVFDKVYRTSVSGTAPVPGIKPVRPGDKAEIYYPSRGIPQKVADNTFTVRKVEYQVSSQEAKTAVEFGTKRPTATETIGNAAVNEIIQRRKSRTGGGSNVVGGFDPVVGTIKKFNDDGTAVVSAENGETYKNVRII